MILGRFSWKWLETRARLLVVRAFTPLEESMWGVGGAGEHWTFGRY